MENFECFIDSSLVVEAFKGNKIAVNLFSLLKHIIFKKIYINNIVWSEIVYQLVFKRNFNKQEILDMLNKFFFLVINEKVLNIAGNFILEYNLKPNDALILATCKHYGIKYLISIDEDFATPCEKEGIVLINSTEKLKEILEKENLQNLNPLL
jgi:predicted nucleic acid-binding protein